MITVLVANPKGGCGKTMIATHLAAACATGGFPTALADTDPQRSSLHWLDSRPADAAPITGIDWTDTMGDPAAGTARLVIDSPASLSMKALRALVRRADFIIVPVLPSAFDVRATADFLKEFRALKAIRRKGKPFAVVRNRVRRGSRSAARLDSFLGDTKTADAGMILDRALYNETAWLGLSIFDLRTRQAFELQRDWIPLVRHIEGPAVNGGGLV